MSIDLTHYDFLEQESRNLRLIPVYTRITKLKRSLIIVRWWFRGGSSADDIDDKLW